MGSIQLVGIGVLASLNGKLPLSFEHTVQIVVTKVNKPLLGTIFTMPFN
jgi:hypothetical protein